MKNWRTLKNKDTVLFNMKECYLWDLIILFSIPLLVIIMGSYTYNPTFLSPKDFENNRTPITLSHLKEPVEGMASWYDYTVPSQYEGAPDVDISKFDNTAASRDFPKGTKLRVCLPDNRHELTTCVVVRVNDYVENPKVIIDLSSHAFEQLAPLSKGLIQVRIEKL